MPYYPFPDPKAYKLNKLLYEAMWNKDLERRLDQDSFKVAREYGLSDETMKVVLKRDVPKMVELGAHPMMAALFSIPATMYRDRDKLHFY